jgi:hypothetical protein
MTRHPITPVAVGQVRIDPDTRMLIRDVKILEVGLSKPRRYYDKRRNGYIETREPCVLIQRGGMGAKVKIAVRRIERWLVK